MPATAGHPPASVLAAFALGKLDAAAAETIHDHLAGCADCRTVVETTPNDSLMALVQQAAAGYTPSQAGSVTRGTRPVPDADCDAADLPPELRDHPRYRIVRKLGQGGMGAVYEAEHRLMERVVAVKVIAPGLVDSPEAAGRFEREVKAAAKLEHPNIVRAYDADRAGTAMLLAMEFVQGRTLADVVAAKGPLPVDYACRCTRQAALGLQHAADHGMVHRDIKPHNLMLTDKGVVKILDFGLAKLASERTTRAGLTGTDVVMGTPEYIAPEQARNSATADVRADIYALGCTLFFLLTGRPPFAGETPIAVMVKHMTDAPPAVTDLRPDVPAELAGFVGRMLAKDPADRPQTPKEVAEALAAFTKAVTKAVTPPPIPAPPANRDPFAGLAAKPPRPAARPAPRRRWLVPVAAAGVLALAAAAIVLTVKTPDGIVTLQVDPPDAKVEVAEGAITVRPKGANEPYTITVARGGGKLRISKEGFEIQTREVTLNDKGTTISAKLEPIPAAPAVPKQAQPPTEPDRNAPPPVGAPAAPAVAPAEPPDVRPPAGDGFVPLFNGKDLTGWSVDGGTAGQWTVEDGALVGRSAAPRTRCYALTDRSYADYALRFEFKVESGHHGVAVRAVPGEKMVLDGKPFFDHPIIKLRHPGTNPKEPTGTTHWVKSAATHVPPAKDLAFFADAWQPMEVVVRKDTCTASIAGEQIVNVTLDPGDRGAGAVVPGLQRASGKVGFQTNTGTIRFRNIEIKELSAAADARPPANDPTKTVPAPAADGFVPLFNGRDLTGWKESLTNKGHARVDDGVLILTATNHGNATYVSEASYADFHLRAEVQNASHRNKFIGVRSAEARRSGAVFTSGYFVSCGGETVRNRHVPPGAFGVEKNVKAGTQIVWRDPTNPASAVPRDQWYWIDVIARGNTVTVLVEGQKVYGYEDAKAPLKSGPIRLTAVSPAELRVRRLEIKTPP